MPKTNTVDEVQVLHFFETGPIEKVEVVFNIVREKMRERLRGRQDEDGGRAAKEHGVARRRAARSGEQATPSEMDEHTESAV
jgi:hypothetical protein